MPVNIIFTEDDIFSLPVQVLVNPVNTCGVMGRGLAKQFKDRYPQMYQCYRRVCDSYGLRVGTLNHYKFATNFRKDGKCEYVVNFPTKKHWKEPSRYEYIETGLKVLARFMLMHKCVSIAIPALGCGCGHLDRTKVKELIMTHFIPHISGVVETVYLVQFAEENAVQYDLSSLCTSKLLV